MNTYNDISIHKQGLILQDVEYPHLPLFLMRVPCRMGRIMKDPMNSCKLNCLTRCSVTCFFLTHAAVLTHRTDIDILKDQKLDIKLLQIIFATQSVLCFATHSICSLLLSHSSKVDIYQAVTFS
ncbi:hypothetical protein KIL84_007895 [Mauremys mutica]|uniref:Uncharacterized protein n=1 Tax=Mauremys mutica TaxID=74926 RepID=A0A9D3X3U1_9SAUR|nr:hypothetical protein KIL84_007895 [Mauremys mutica]